MAAVRRLILGCRDAAAGFASAMPYVWARCVHQQVRGASTRAGSAVRPPGPDLRCVHRGRIRGASTWAGSAVRPPGPDLRCVHLGRICGASTRAGSAVRSPGPDLRCVHQASTRAGSAVRALGPGLLRNGACDCRRGYDGTCDFRRDCNGTCAALAYRTVSGCGLAGLLLSELAKLQLYIWGSRKT